MTQTVRLLALTCLALASTAGISPFGAAAQTPAPSLDCIVEPSMTVKVGSPVSTTLAAVEVVRGDRVTRGQVIARLDSGVEQADTALAEARARNMAEIEGRRSRLDFATSDLSRGTRLLDNANISQQKVEELRTNFRVAQQDLATAELNHRVAILEFARSQALLNQRLIRSPVDGVVTQRLLNPGEYVHQDNQIVVLAVISPLHVQVYPPVRLRNQVALGQTGRLLLTEPAGLQRDGTISVIDSVFDAASGTFGIQLDLPNPDGIISGGQRCRVAFDGSAPTGPAIR